MRFIVLLFLCLFAFGLVFAAEVSFFGPGYIGGTTSLGIAPSGELWVANQGVIAIYTAEGQFDRLATRYQAHDALLFNANDIFSAFGPGRIRWYHGTDLVMAGSGFAGYAPRDMAMDAHGIIYATDGGNNRIQKYEIMSLGKPYLGEISTNVVEPMAFPYSIALDAQGRIFVTDEQKPGVWVFQPDGAFVQRFFADRQCFRIRRGPDGMYVVTDRAGVTVFDPDTGQVLREMPRLPGIGNGLGESRGFAVDAQGNFYIGHQYHEIRKFSRDGQLLQIIGHAYDATVTLPDQCAPGQVVQAPLKVRQLATLPVGTIPPVFSARLLPAFVRSEADLGIKNTQIATGELQQRWIAQRAARLEAQAHVLAVTQDAESVHLTIPATVPTGVYRLQLHAEHGSPLGITDREVVIRVVAPQATANMTLFVPRQRSVFRLDETVEVNAIIRSKEALPAGTLSFSLARRQGDSLDFQPDALPLQVFPVAAMSAGTLTFHLPAGALHQGRYLLQAAYAAGALSFRDTWPLEIVSALRATPFEVLLPEWGAGYTNLVGPFTGQGMRADAAQLGHAGYTLVDVAVHNRGEGPAIAPAGEDAPRAAQLAQQARDDFALPAPERYLPPSPLEVELQEALRNGYRVQRDIWGGWYMADWGYGNPLRVAQDNRHARLWTQWQREWPSWIGHRYLSLVSVDRSNQEAQALASAQGMTIPTVRELAWAQNPSQRQFITDPQTPGLYYWTGVGVDLAGNIYLGSRAMVASYTAEGQFRWMARASCNNDITVAPDGTVYGADTEGRVTIVSPDGQRVTSWKAADFSGHSPRGIFLEQSGTLLLVDQADDGSNRQKLVRYTTDGKLLATLADARQLKQPAKVAVLADGAIAVTDPGRGGLVLLNADGTPSDFLPDVVQDTPGGTSAVCAAPDGTIWTTNGMWRQVNHIDRQGKVLKTLAYSTLAIGGIAYPTSLCMTKDGTLLVGDIGFPYVTEFRGDGTPSGRIFGIQSMLLDMRIDRTRYSWQDARILASIWRPIPEKSGDPTATLQAFARNVDGPWVTLPVTAFSTVDFGLPVPRLTGKVTLRLLWEKPGAGADDAQRTDFTIEVSEKPSAQEQAQMAEIRQREIAWKTHWARARMGALSRWTAYSNQIRPGTQSTAPRNYGGYDNLSGGVWPPFRREALVAETENEGHDHGTFPLMGAWYTACNLAGVDPLPAWSSLLEWFWDQPKSYQRPLRDMVVYLGAGASGLGTGKPETVMNDSQRALLGKVHDRLLRVGTAGTGLDLPGQGGVAVLHSFTQEAMSPAWTDEHFYTAHAAWYDLLRAHIPTAVVNEAFIESENGTALARRFQAILLPEILHPLPATTLAALANFRARGGEVWVDLSTQQTIPGAKWLPVRYWPFWVQETYYQYMDRGGMGYDGNFEYWRMKQGSDIRLPAIREAFGKYATMPIASDDANVFLQQRQGGVASYIFAANDHYPDKPLWQTRISHQAPVPATVPFTLAGGAIYDALAMKPVTEKRLQVEFTNEEPARVWVVLPRPIGQVKVTGVLRAGMLVVSAQVADAAGAVLPAVIPLEITVNDAEGGQQYHCWRATNVRGNSSEELPIGSLAPQGAWTVTVRELLSGKSAQARVTITPRPLPVLTLTTNPVLVFDSPAIATWLAAQKGQEIWVALDNGQQPLAASAISLVEALVLRGITARLITISDIPEVVMRLSYKLTAEQEAIIARVDAGQAVGLRVDDGSHNFIAPGPQRAIARPLILLGDPAQNRWLKDINDAQLTPRTLSPSYPGPGRALLQYAWSPFFDGKDVITISAQDSTGVQAGIDALLKIK